MTWFLIQKMYDKRTKTKGLFKEIQFDVLSKDVGLLYKKYLETKTLDTDVYYTVFEGPFYRDTNSVS